MPKKQAKESISLSSLDEAEAIAQRKLTECRDAIWKTDWKIMLGKGVKITNEKNEVKWVPKHVAEQWAETELARKKQKSAFDALAQFAAIGQFEARHDHKLRVLGTQKHYLSAEDLTGDALFNPKAATDTLAGRAREFDTLVQDSLDEMAIAKEAGKTYKDEVYEHFSEGLRWEIADLTKISDDLRAIEAIANEAKAKNLFFDTKGLEFLQNTFKRMANATSIEEMAIYQKHFLTVLWQICFEKPAVVSAEKQAAQDTLWQQLGALGTEIDQTTKHYGSIHSDLLESKGIDAKYDKVYLEALSDLAITLMIPAMEATRIASHELIHGVADTTQSGLGTAKIASTSYSAEQMMHFTDKIRIAIQQNKIPIGLGAAGVVSLLVFPELATGVAVIEGLHSLAHLTSEAKELKTMTDKIGQRLDAHEKEFDAYNQYRKEQALASPKGLRGHSLLKPPVQGKEQHVEQDAEAQPVKKR